MEKLREKINKLLYKEREKTLKEISVLEEHLQETEQMYGVGGAYSRQEKAIEKRQDKLAQIDDFDIQLHRAVEHVTMTVYVNNCDRCGTIWMTNKRPFDDWHECPTCRGMVKCRNTKSVELKVADDGGDIMNQIKEILEEQDSNSEVEENETN